MTKEEIRMNWKLALKSQDFISSIIGWGFYLQDLIVLGALTSGKRLKIFWKIATSIVNARYFLMESMTSTQIISLKSTKTSDKIMQKHIDSIVSL